MPLQLSLSARRLRPSRKRRTFSWVPLDATRRCSEALAQARRSCSRGRGGPRSPAPGSRHAILRLRANAVRSAISLDTLPKVMRLCFPGVRIEEHRMDGSSRFPHNDSQIWVGGLDDKERVEKILGQEYATIFLNECSQIPYGSVTSLARVWRKWQDDTTGQPLSQRMYYDLNPIGKGHWSNTWSSASRRVPSIGSRCRDPDNYGRMQINPVDNKQNLSADFLSPWTTCPRSSAAASTLESTLTRSTVRSGPTRGSMPSGSSSQSYRLSNGLLSRLIRPVPGVQKTPDQTKSVSASLVKATTAGPTSSRTLRAASVRLAGRGGPSRPSTAGSADASSQNELWQGNGRGDHPQRRP
jgi:hypothetical protein